MDEPRESVRKAMLVDLRVNLPALIRSYEKERDGWCQRYPGIALQIQQRFAPMIARERERLEQVEQGVIPPKEVTDPDVLKRELWEFFTLLSTVDPDLPIVEMHDRYCADLDTARSRYNESLARIDAIYEEAQHLAYDIRLLAATGDHEEARRLQEEFERRHREE